MMRMTGSQMLIFEMVGMALLVLFFLLHIRKRNRLMLQCRNEASGEVSDILVKDTGKDNIYCYQLMVSFDTGSGTVQGPDAWDTKKGEFSKGDHVTVRYNPDNPKVFYVVENQRYEYLVKVYLSLILFYPVLMVLTYIVGK